MRCDDVSDETLNAYVDGELGAEEASRLAQAAAGNPALARRIAMLHHLRAGVASMVPENLVLGLPAVPAAARPSGHLPLRAALRAAALVLAIGAGFWFWQGGAERAPADAMAQIVGSHDVWHNSLALADARQTQAPEWVVSLMQATGLRLVHSGPERLADGSDVLHYAFIGENRSKISLFEMPQPPGTLPAAFEISASGQLQTAFWQAHGRGYAMVARSMDMARFATIAHSIHAATEARQADHPQLMAAMEAARQRCLA